jgi:hypothetical protein
MWRHFHTKLTDGCNRRGFDGGLLVGDRSLFCRWGWLEMDKISITVFVYDGFRYWAMRNLKSIYLRLHREHSRCRHGDGVSLSLCKVLLRDGVKNAVGCSNGDVTAKFGGRVFITALFQGRSHWANQPCSKLREGEVTQNVTRCRRTAESVVISEGSFAGDV